MDAHAIARMCPVRSENDNSNGVEARRHIGAVVVLQVRERFFLNLFRSAHRICLLWKALAVVPVFFSSMIVFFLRLIGQKINPKRSRQPT